MCFECCVTEHFAIQYKQHQLKCIAALGRLWPLAVQCVFDELIIICECERSCASFAPFGTQCNAHITPSAHEPCQRAVLPSCPRRWSFIRCCVALQSCICVHAAHEYATAPLRSRARAGNMLFTLSSHSGNSSDSSCGSVCVSPIPPVHPHHRAARALRGALQLVIVRSVGRQLQGGFVPCCTARMLFQLLGNNS